MKGSQTNMESAQLITRNTAYIAKSWKSLFIPLLDLIKGTRLLDGLLLPALLWRQPKVVTVPAAMAQLLTSLTLRFPAREEGSRITQTKKFQIKPNKKSWVSRKKEDAMTEIKTLQQQFKESQRNVSKMLFSHSVSSRKSERKAVPYDRFRRRWALLKKHLQHYFSPNQKEKQVWQNPH